MGFRDRMGGGGSRGGSGGGGRYGDDRGGSSGGFNRFDKPSFRQFREAPVKSGEEYDVEITDVAAKGDGIAKVEGFIIFIAGARKGEKCRIRIMEVRNRFAIGQRVEGGAAAATTTEAATEDASEEESEVEGTQ